MKLISLFTILLTSTVSAQPAYDRDEWRHWSDFDSDCQDTRAELLISTSLAPVTFTNDRGCTVATGLWIGPYTGQVFVLASDMDIDHIIAPKYAHDHGGALWSPLLKKVFANDPDNLLATKDNANQSKGARWPSRYMPPLLSYRCEYIRRWRFLISKYELKINEEDDKVIKSANKACP